MAIANATQNAILALIFQAVAWAGYADNTVTSPQANMAVALHPADPGAAGSQATSEATYTAYARASVARSAAGWTLTGASPTQISPAAVIGFPAGTAGAGTVTNFSTGKTGGGATPI